MNKNELGYFASLVKEKVGWLISGDDLFLISAKVDNIIRKYGLDDTQALIKEIEKYPKSFLWTVIEELAPLTTWFYRDYKVVRDVDDVLFPFLQEQNYSTKKIKILSLGCSTGQEVYSVAMSIKKKIPDYKNWNIELLGVDLSSEAILKAQKGSYSEFEIQYGLNARDMIENFKSDGDNWQAKKELLKRVSFKRANIYKDNVSDEKYDLIFCCNVLNTFTPEAQKEVMEKIYEHQVMGGFLCLGVGERINGLEEFYDSSNMECVYKAKYSAGKKTSRVFSDTDMPTFERPESLRMIKKM
ncbi:MAG: methyltransferase domain-containing protein [Lactobacillaceae bacterium]|jgi:chemotaxis protein methyltransferase CheR|nr:methyltransferase domain-containing protein [Lactobacillaceae bacterium]